MEKKKFTQPQMKVVNMATEQVIAASSQDAVKLRGLTAGGNVFSNGETWN